MTTQTLEGFLLTRNWRDASGGLELEFWFATEQGPVQVLVRGERSVFFLEANQIQRARALLAHEPGLEIKEVALRDFRLNQVNGVYLPSYRQARRAADLLREQGLEPLEADINPADRYLMERFVSGAALLHGELLRAGRHLQLIDPGMKSANYRPGLKVVSFDIETAMEGIQLYSIAVDGRCGEELSLIHI